MTPPIRRLTAGAVQTMLADGAWPVGVKALFTLRGGGASPAPFDSWNLGDHVGDDFACVQANRQLLAQRLAAQPVFLRQVHGTGVVRLTPDTPAGLVADACWSDSPGVACTIMVADCLPLLFSAADGSSVAAAHAGWRGLVGEDGHGVLESLFAQWPAAQTPAQRAGIKAWLGPCIGPQAFEVGAEVRAAFLAAQPEADHCFQALPVAPDGTRKYRADLRALAQQRLCALGVQHISGNDGSLPWCTVQQASRFFSHRRDARRLGSTGRMAACIWRT